MLKRSFLVLALTLWAACSWAQSGDHVEIFGGYSYARYDFTGGALYASGGLSRGWNASLNIKFKPRVGFESDLAGYYQHFGSNSGVCFRFGSSCGSSAYTIMFGPQFSIPLAKFTPYFHVLLGLAHGVTNGTFSNSNFQNNNSFAMAWGGGLDYHLTRHFALRGQTDFLQTHFKSIDNQAPFRYNNNAILSGGLVLRF